MELRLVGFDTRGQFDGPQPIVHAFLPVEVLPAHVGGIGQGLNLQRHVPLTPGDGDRPPQRLLSPFVVTVRGPKNPAVAGKETPCFVGIGRYHGESTSHELGDA